MDYFILVIVGVAGILLGYYLAQRKDDGLIFMRSKKKAKNKKKILEFLKEKKRVTNNDVEKLLGVSDATATRYMDELEKERKVRQIGATGRAVHYILK